MGEGYAQAGGQNDVVIEGSWRRERGVVVTEGCDPVEHFSDLSAEVGVECQLDLAQIAQVRINISLLGEQASRTDLAGVLFAEIERRETVCGAGSDGCGRVVFVSPDNTAEDIEGLEPQVLPEPPLKVVTAITWRCSPGRRAGR